MSVGAWVKINRYQCLSSIFSFDGVEPSCQSIRSEPSPASFDPEFQ